MSIFILCDYGLSPAIAKKLYSLNITPQDISIENGIIKVYYETFDDAINKIKKEIMLQ